MAEVRGLFARLELEVRKRHIFHILRQLRTMMSSSKHEDENADAGSWSTAGPKTKMGEAKRRIKNLFAQFNSATISLNDYLEAMKYKTQHFVIRVY